MQTRYEVKMNGAALSALDDSIYITDIQEEAPRMEVSTIGRAGTDGQTMTAEKRLSLSVRVTFAIRAYDTARRKGTAVPVMPVVETLREMTDGGSRTVERWRFRSVQTPQVFDIGLLKRAYQQEESSVFTDDASVVEHLGHDIVLVEGNRENIKITTPFDLQIASLLI